MTNASRGGSIDRSGRKGKLGFGEELGGCILFCVPRGELVEGEREKIEVEVAECLGLPGEIRDLFLADWTLA